MNEKHKQKNIEKMRKVLLIEILEEFSRNERQGGLGIWSHAQGWIRLIVLDAKILVKMIFETKQKFCGSGLCSARRFLMFKETAAGQISFVEDCRVNVLSSLSFKFDRKSSETWKTSLGSLYLTLPNIYSSLNSTCGTGLRSPGNFIWSWKNRLLRNESVRREVGERQ